MPIIQARAEFCLWGVARVKTCERAYRRHRRAATPKSAPMRQQTENGNTARRGAPVRLDLKPFPNGESRTRGRLIFSPAHMRICSQHKSCYFTVNVSCTALPEPISQKKKAPSCTFLLCRTEIIRTGMPFPTHDVNNGVAWRGGQQVTFPAKSDAPPQKACRIRFGGAPRRPLSPRSWKDSAILPLPA